MYERCRKSADKTVSKMRQMIAGKYTVLDIFFFNVSFCMPLAQCTSGNLNNRAILHLLYSVLITSVQQNKSFFSHQRQLLSLLFYGQ
jgi:hypothetical protein